MPYTIRSMTPEDLIAILAIEKSAHISPWSLSIFESCFGDNYQNWLIQSEGNIAGYLIAKSVADEASLLNLCVAPAFQRRGLAGQLLQHWLTQLKSGIGFVWLEVRASNQSAIHLYDKFDFIEQGIRPNYYPSKNGAEDAIVMVKTL